MNRRLFLGALAAAPEARLWADQTAHSLARGVAYLSSRQSAGGGWQSSTYGLLRSGQSLTPLVVNALLDAGVAKDDARIVRAVDYIVRTIDDETDDYPCYSAALALRALVRAHSPSHPLVPRLVEWLRGQQMGPANGWTEDQPAFGAWGIGGAPRKAPHSGHIDISMTRHVLEALAEAGVPATDSAMKDGRVFVRRCRNADGGFFFSTVETGANKGGEDGGGYLSYGTTTADGILCLIATGDPELAPSLAWLEAHDHPILPQGFKTEARRRYANGLRYYYADAAVRAFRAVNRERKVPYLAALRAAQRRDGSWANPEVLVKEDDPLIATSFALSACGKLVAGTILSQA